MLTFASPELAAQALATEVLWSSGARATLRPVGCLRVGGGSGPVAIIHASAHPAMCLTTCAHMCDHQVCFVFLACFQAGQSATACAAPPAAAGEAAGLPSGAARAAGAGACLHLALLALITMIIWCLFIETRRSWSASTDVRLCVLSCLARQAPTAARPATFLAATTAGPAFPPEPPATQARGLVLISIACAHRNPHLVVVHRDSSQFAGKHRCSSLSVLSCAAGTDGSADVDFPRGDDRGPGAAGAAPAARGDDRGPGATAAPAARGDDRGRGPGTAAPTARGDDRGRRAARAPAARGDDGAHGATALEARAAGVQSGDVGAAGAAADAGRAGGPPTAAAGDAAAAAPPPREAAGEVAAASDGPAPAGPGVPLALARRRASCHLVVRGG